MAVEDSYISLTGLKVGDVPTSLYISTRLTYARRQGITHSTPFFDGAKYGIIIVTYETDSL